MNNRVDERRGATNRRDEDADARPQAGPTEIDGHHERDEHALDSVRV
jgi:hypothetical protein